MGDDDGEEDALLPPLDEALTRGLFGPAPLLLALEAMTFDLEDRGDEGEIAPVAAAICGAELSPGDAAAGCGPITDPFSSASSSSELNHISSSSSSCRGSRRKRVVRNNEGTLSYTFPNAN